MGIFNEFFVKCISIDVWMFSLYLLCVLLIVMMVLSTRARGTGKSSPMILLWCPQIQTEECLCCCMGVLFGEGGFITRFFQI